MLGVILADLVRNQLVGGGHVGLAVPHGTDLAPHQGICG
jgi:hypothetical protein